MLNWTLTTWGYKRAVVKVNSAISRYSSARSSLLSCNANAFAPPYCPAVCALRVPSDANPSTQVYDEGVPGLDSLWSTFRCKWPFCAQG